MEEDGEEVSEHGKTDEGGGHARLAVRCFAKDRQREIVYQKREMVRKESERVKDLSNIEFLMDLTT